MRTSRDRNWDLIGDMLAAESSGKSPRMFSSRKTLFGIPSALDQELAELERQAASTTPDAEALKGGDATVTAAMGNETAKRMGESAAAERAAGRKGKATRVTHPLKPVVDDRSRVLILGTMPSPKSRETGFYYNHPQNRFWRVMAALFDEPVPATNEEKEALALRHGIALWDVLAECTIEGAADGTIAECVPNDIGALLRRAPIEAIFCTGAKAAELYAKHCEPATGMAATRLPSTSPANAAASLPQLIEAYRSILPFCIR